MKPAASSKSRLADFRAKGFSAFGPKKPTSKGAQRRSYLKEYVHWLWPQRWALSLVFLLALVGAALDMVWPLAIKTIIDLMPAPLPVAQKLTRLKLFGAAILALLLLKQAADSTRSWKMAQLNAKVVFRLRKALFEKLLHLSLGELGEMKSGGITSRLSGDIEAVTGLVQSAVISPGVAAARVVLTAAVLLYLSWKLAVAALIMTPPMALLSFLWMRRVRPIYRSVHEDRTNVDARVNETFGGIRVVRAFRRESREGRGYAVNNHTIIRKRLFAEKLEMVLEAGWGLLIPATSLLIVGFGGYLVLQSQLHPAGPQTGVGDIFAFQIYAVLLIQPVWQIISSMSATQKALAAMERVFDTMRLDPDKPDSPNAVGAPAAVQSIRFDHVCFAYRPGTPVIRDFSLDVPGGSTVALVGPSGAGKTTLCDLVARFHDPTTGRITLNGTDLRQFRLRAFRSMLAVVQQETFLFDGTVAENIAYGRRNASPADIERAARRANAHEFIAALPEAYDTLIGERGFKLSGGQRQRLSIARAILADPQILILDEATSNLDTESEQLIQQSLADLLRDRTTFVIAHRLSTITHADLIVVMDHGRILETGRHDDLLDRRGPYFEMVERQRLAFAQEVEERVE